MSLNVTFVCKKFKKENNFSDLLMLNIQQQIAHLHVCDLKSRFSQGISIAYMYMYVHVPVCTITL